jgi:hypothetical protein
MIKTVGGAYFVLFEVFLVVLVESRHCDALMPNVNIVNESIHQGRLFAGLLLSLMQIYKKL